MPLKDLISNLSIEVKPTAEFDITPYLQNTTSKVRLVFECPSAAALAGIRTKSEKIKTQRPQWNVEFRQAIGFFLIAYKGAFVTESDGVEQWQERDIESDFVLIHFFDVAGQNHPEILQEVNRVMGDAFPTLVDPGKEADDLKNE